MRLCEYEIVSNAGDPVKRKHDQRKRGRLHLVVGKVQLSGGAMGCCFWFGAGAGE